MAEKLVFLAEFDETQAKKNVVSYTKEITNLKAAQKELATQYNQGLISQDAFAKKSVDLTSKLQQVQTALKATNKDLGLSARFQTAAKGSIEANKIELEALRKEYEQLAEPTAAQTKRLKDLSDRLKEQEKAIGDTRRNVGNYTESIIKAFDGTGLLTKGIETLKTAQATLTEVHTIAKASILGNASAMGILRAALISSGIGALVVILGSLVAWLTKTQKGMDLVSRVFAGASTIVNVLVDKLAAVGQKVIDFVSGFENLGDAIKKIGALILENLINRIKGFAVILEGIVNRDFSKIQDGFVQINTGITDATAKSQAFTKELWEAAKAGAAIEAESQRIRDAEIKLNVERAKSKAAIEKLKFAIEDTTKSENARIAAAKEAFALEQGSVDRQIKLQQDLIANIKAKAALTKTTSKGSVEVATELAEAETKLAELQEGSMTRQIELNNKINELNALKKQKAEEKAKAEKEAFEKELEYQRESDKARREGEEARAKYEAEQLQKKFDKQIKALQRQLGIEKDFIEQRRKAVQESYDQEDLDLLQRRLNGQVNDFQFQSEKLANEEAFLQKQIDIARAAGESTVELEKQLTQKRIDTKEFEAAEFERIESTKLDIARQSLAALSGFMQLFAEDASENASFQKAMAIFQVGLDTVQAISGIIRAAGSTSLTPIDLALKIAAGTATVFANLAKVKDLLTKQPPKAPKANAFAEGVVDLAGPGTTTSDSIPAWLSRGESVINARATSTFKPMLAAMNAFGNGKTFAYAEGGEAGRMAGDFGLPAGLTASQVRDIIASMPPQILRVRDLDTVYDQRSATALVSDI